MNDRLDSLIEGYLNETLSAEESSQLDTLLKKSRPARDEFRDRVAIHGSLSEHYSENGDAGFEPILSGSPRTRQQWTPIHFWLGGALLLALSTLVIAVIRSPANQPEVARIIYSDSRPAGPIKRGKFSLTEGFADIQMADGARFAVESGVQLDFKSTNRVRLLQGRLGAFIPEHAGEFVVETPGGEVVDLGPRFAISVDDSGETHAELYGGEMEVQPHKTDSQSFAGPAVVEIDPQGNSVKKLDEDLQPLQFPMPEIVEVIPVTQGSFEPGETYEIGEATLDKIGVWGGNVARIVEATGDIRPYEGQGMLQLISASPEPSASGRSFCDVVQWIDLRQIPFQKAIVSLKMVVNRVAGDENTDTSFTLKLNPSSKAPTELTPEEQDSFERSLEWSVTREADADPASWEDLRITAELPADTRYLRIKVGASENRENNQEPGEVEFDGHFIDQVEMELLIPARSSVES